MTECSIDLDVPTRIQVYISGALALERGIRSGSMTSFEEFCHLKLCDSVWNSLDASGRRMLTERFVAEVVPHANAPTVTLPLTRRLVDIDIVRRLEQPAYGDRVGEWTYVNITAVSFGTERQHGAWLHDAGVSVTLPVDGELVYDALERVRPGSTTVGAT